MSSVIRQYLAYLLIALLPLQAAAAGQLALCAAMSDAQAGTKAVSDHCAQMGSMRHSPSDMQASDVNYSDNHAPQATSGCWLGSICLAGLGATALPVAYTITRIDRVTPVPLPKSTHYHSIIAAVPQRPPASLS